MASLKDMFPSRFLGKEDIAHPIRATIQRLGQEAIKGDGGDQNKNVLYFSGNLKPMILNKGNAMLLAALFGDDSSAWIGKTVELFVDPSVMFGGKMVGGVRLRAATGAPPSQNGHAPNTLTFAQAIEEAGRVGISKEMLIAELKKSGLAGYDAKRDTAAVRRMIEAASGTAHEESFDDALADDGGQIPF